MRKRSLLSEKNPRIYFISLHVSSINGAHHQI